jgi:hypothetical protein
VAVGGQQETTVCSGFGSGEFSGLQIGASRGEQLSQVLRGT